jgi:hypothetical protein
MVKTESPYTLVLASGKISDIAQDTFVELQNVVSKVLKETGATNINISAPNAHDTQVKTLFVDSVSNP